MQRVELRDVCGERCTGEFLAAARGDVQACCQTETTVVLGECEFSVPVRTWNVSAQPWK